ncbi:MAG: PEP-utilizing enzyme [Patescibacteria group bacterium]
MHLKSFINKLPKDLSQHAVRDISILSCSVFGKTHAVSMKRIFGVKFSATLWVKDNKQIIFYRSKSEYDSFSRIAGMKFLQNKDFVNRICQKLIYYTDWFNSFLKNNANRKSFSKDFFTKYRDFFAYHQAVYWGGDYLSKLNSPSAKIKKIIKRLKNVYKYNELVVPNIECFFSKVGIADYVYSDILSKRIINNYNKKVGLLFIGSRMFVLKNYDVKFFKKFIQSEKILSDNIRGLSVYPGYYQGRICLISSLYDFKKIRKNSVLVTSMTRPQFNKYISRAGAIICDEGGMLSHAAILAREAKIPTIVGTKVATKVFSNGDLVEVDANRGLIKILKRK